MGMDGWRYMLKSSQGLPVEFFWQVPPCVPATCMETSGGEVGLAELEQALQLYPDCPALAEMMNYPGVLYGSPAVAELIQSAQEKGLSVEGHAHGSGQNLARRTKLLLRHFHVII
jgi:adenine deaminase